jgi:hypothetical protein
VVDEPAGIGVSADSLKVPLDQQRQYAEAVRESIHRRVVDLLERNGLAASPDLLECPSCESRLILLEEPATFSFLPAEGIRVCAACGAEREFLHVVHPDTDIGGEGG